MKRALRTTRERVTGIRLRNFKCFGDQQIRFASLNLLTGLNSAGKSTVLQALLVLKQSYDQGLLQVGELALNGDYVHLGTAQDVLFDRALEDVIEITLVAEPGRRLTWKFAYDRTAEILLGVAASKEYPAPVFGEKFIYLTAERIGPRTTYLISDSRGRGPAARLGLHGEFTGSYLALEGDKPIPNRLLAHPSESKLTLIRQVEAWLGEVSPGARISLDSYSSMDLVQIQYSFVRGRDTGPRVRPTNVGFGVSYVLPVLVALLAAGKDSTLIIENPEAHLHPRGQVKIGSLVALAAAAGVQVFLESHSDHVLNGIRLAVRDGHISAKDVSINFFERIEGGNPKLTMGSSVFTPQILPDGRIDNWPPGFFDEFQKTSLNFLRKPNQ